MIAVLIVIHVLVCIFLILIILMQPGRGESLSEVFGGSVTQNIFGAKAGTFLTKASTVLAIIFALSSVLLGITLSHRGRTLMESQVVKESKQSEPAAKPGAPAPAAPAGTDVTSETPPAAPAEAPAKEAAPAPAKENPAP